MQKEEKNSRVAAGLFILLWTNMHTYIYVCGLYIYSLHNRSIYFLYLRLRICVCSSCAAGSTVSHSLYCSRLTFKAALLRFYNFYHTLTLSHWHIDICLHTRTHLKAKICVKFRRRRFLLFCCVCEVLKVRQIKYKICVLLACVCLCIDSFHLFGMFCWKRLCSFLLQFVFYIFTGISLKAHFKAF